MDHLSSFVKGSSSISTAEHSQAPISLHGPLTALVSGSPEPARWSEVTGESPHREDQPPPSLSAYALSHVGLASNPTMSEIMAQVTPGSRLSLNDAHQLLGASNAGILDEDLQNSFVTENRECKPTSEFYYSYFCFLI
jgi:hypothetical protein